MAIPNQNGPGSAEQKIKYSAAVKNARAMLVDKLQAILINADKNPHHFSIAKADYLLAQLEHLNLTTSALTDHALAQTLAEKNAKYRVIQTQLKTHEKAAKDNVSGWLTAGKVIAAVLITATFIALGAATVLLIGALTFGLALPAAIGGGIALASAISGAVAGGAIGSLSSFAFFKKSAAETTQVNLIHTAKQLAKDTNSLSPLP